LYSFDQWWLYIVVTLLSIQWRDDYCIVHYCDILLLLLFIRDDVTSRYDDIGYWLFWLLSITIVGIGYCPSWRYWWFVDIRWLLLVLVGIDVAIVSHWLLLLMLFYSDVPIDVTPHWWLSDRDDYWCLLLLLLTIVIEYCYLFNDYSIWFVVIDLVGICVMTIIDWFVLFIGNIVDECYCYSSIDLLLLCWCY